MKMICKVALVVILSVVVVQSYVPLTDELGSIDFDFILNNCKNVLRAAITGATEQLQDLERVVRGKVDAMVAKTRSLLSAELDKFLDELKRLKEEAKQLGLDIADCLKDREDYLKGLPEVYVRKVVKCGEDKYNEAKAIVQEVRNEVEGSYNIIRQRTQEYNNCGGWTAITCVIEVTGNIAADAVNIPKAIISKTEVAVQLVESLYPDLQLCGIKVVEDFLVEANDIVQNIRNCVTSKIKPATPKSF